jgi:hypothetical protein
MSEPMHVMEESIEIDARPEEVYALVCAMDRHGEWSTENCGGYWRKGPDGVPGTGKIGDQFVGINRQGEREWKAPVEIVEADPPRSWAFVTGGLDLNIALWKYIVEPSGSGTRLTEYYELRNPSPAMVEGGQAAVDERMAINRASMKATLAGIKAAAEG